MSDDEHWAEVYGKEGNSKDLRKAFSLLQHAAGRTPDEEMRMFETTDEKPTAT